MLLGRPNPSGDLFKSLHQNLLNGGFRADVVSTRLSSRSPRPSRSQPSWPLHPAAPSLELIAGLEPGRLVCAGDASPSFSP